MFATKGKNKGKLDSHCWYFDAFCYLLQPEYCILFDAGAPGAGAPGKGWGCRDAGGRGWPRNRLTARCSQPCFS